MDYWLMYKTLPVIHYGASTEMFWAKYVNDTASANGMDPCIVPPPVTSMMNILYSRVLVFHKDEINYTRHPSVRNVFMTHKINQGQQRLP